MKRSTPPTSLRSRRWRIVAGALALGVGAASCGSSDTATDVSAGTSQTAGSAASQAPVASTASGGQIDFGALEGTDYVLWFWAPW